MLVWGSRLFFSTLILVVSFMMIQNPMTVDAKNPIDNNIFIIIEGE